MTAIKNNKKKKSSKKKININKEVVLLKLIVLFVVLVIPIVIIVISMNKQMLVLKYKDGNKNINDQIKTNINKEEEDFNLDVPIPNERVGSMANVSQDKIDSLFDNLKE